MNVLTADGYINEEQKDSHYRWRCDWSRYRVAIGEKRVPLLAIYERAEAGRSASWAAAGMLAPLAEAHIEEPELLKLGCQSLTLYPKWVRELEADAGMSIGYRVEGTLIVGLEPDDTHQLRHLHTSQQELGLDVEWLTGRAAREIEPALSPRVTAAIHCETDHQVDNRLMVKALQRAYQRMRWVCYTKTTQSKASKSRMGSRLA